MNAMKKNSFLTVALAALTLFSCSEDDSNSKDLNPIDPGKEAKIALSFVGATNTKVISTAVDADDQVINDASVFVFRTNGAIDVDRQFLAGFASDAPQEITATTAAKTVYVVTNIGNAAAHNAMFAGVQSEAALQSLVKDRNVDLYSATDATGETDIKATDVLMTGSGIVADFAGTTTSTVDIDLTFPISKIRLIVKDNRINNMLATAVSDTGHVAIVDDNVLLIRAGKSIKFFSDDLGADQAVQASFYSGWPTDGGTFMDYFSDDATSSAAIWHAGNDNVSTGSTNTIVTHHFYTAANNGNNAATPTVLTIESTRTTWDIVNSVTETETIYYPIHFSSVDAGTTLLPGKSYVVTLTLSGNVGGGGGTGVVDPLTLVVDGSITATITVASWDPVTIDKEIN